MQMLFWAIGILSAVLGFCTAIYLVFEKYSSEVSGKSVFVTAVAGIIFSLVTAVVMVMVIWPPVNVFSWLLFAGFAAGVSALVLTGNNSRKEIENNFKSINNRRVDLRSGTGD
jgi:formate hydrogenlyase subunit 3/multisubunit Na+/H+ antiporter MnhD subunit